MHWTSPFSLAGHWYKGNLHTHTTQSDGLFTPDQAIAWYREHGYDFIAVTDHWVFTQGQTFAPSTQFITLSGAELHGPGYHMLALGSFALPDEATGDSAQAIADAIGRQGGLAYIAHPYWMGQTSADIGQIGGLAGVEVFNSVCEMMDGLGYASVQWDELLASGLRLTGLAVDDVHWRHGAQGQGFVMVRAPQLEEQAILEALRSGHFYASTGPTLSDLRVVAGSDGGPALQVRCSPCQSITFYAAASHGHRFKAAAGEWLDGAVWPIRAEQVYLRVECRDAMGHTAWSNPVFVQDVL
ncbi:MAG: CehA/McbA family metallohydrolase [Anaerolineae bacterium]|nr:CehA/McbA family metallohydrolase [Anaerolineae bacterium]